MLVIDKIIRKSKVNIYGARIYRKAEVKEVLNLRFEAYRQSKIIQSLKDYFEFDNYKIVNNKISFSVLECEEGQRATLLEIQLCIQGKIRLYDCKYICKVFTLKPYQLIRDLNYA